MSPSSLKMFQTSLVLMFGGSPEKLTASSTQCDQSSALVTIALLRRSVVWDGIGVERSKTSSSLTLDNGGLRRLAKAELLSVRLRFRERPFEDTTGVSIIAGCTLLSGDVFEMLVTWSSGPSELFASSPKDAR